MQGVIATIDIKNFQKLLHQTPERSGYEHKFVSAFSEYFSKFIKNYKTSFTEIYKRGNLTQLRNLKFEYPDKITEEILPCFKQWFRKQIINTERLYQ